MLLFWIVITYTKKKKKNPKTKKKYMTHGPEIPFLKIYTEILDTI